MSILNRFGFGKNKEIPSPENDNFGEMNFRNDSPPMDNLNDQTGLGNIGGQPDNLGLPNTRFPQTPGNSPHFEQIPDTPPSQPSSFNELNKTKSDSDLNTLSKNIEIISSKVDTLKAILDSLSQKIEKIEKIAEGEKEEKPKRSYNGW